MPAGAAPGGAPACLSTGWPTLDTWLGGGWVAGTLAELKGRGRSSLALGAVRWAQRHDLPVAWVHAHGGFCAATARVDLARLDLLRVPPAPDRGRRRARDASAADAGPTAPVRSGARPTPARSTQALRATELLLRARAHALVVLDLPPGPAPPAAFFRLARLAARARSALLLLQDHRRCLAGSATPRLLEVRLVVPAEHEPLDPELHPPELELHLRRQRGSHQPQGVLRLHSEDHEVAPPHPASSR